MRLYTTFAGLALGDRAVALQGSARGLGASPLAAHEVQPASPCLQHPWQGWRPNLLARLAGVLRAPVMLAFVSPTAMTLPTR